MKKIFLGSMILLFVTAVWGEDLGELAKKEKARREALQKEGKKATVLTNQDVPKIKSSLGIESITPVDENPPVDPAVLTDPTDPTPAEAVDDAIADSSAELEELKRQKAELTKEIQDTSDSIQDSGSMARNTGERYREKRLKEEELKKVEEQIEELETKQKENSEPE